MVIECGCLVVAKSNWILYKNKSDRSSKNQNNFVGNRLFAVLLAVWKNEIQHETVKIQGEYMQFHFYLHFTAISE